MKPGKKIYPGSLKRIGYAFIIFVLLCGLFLGLQKAHRETRRSLERVRYELVNRLVREQLNRVVEYQVKVLQILAHRYETTEPQTDAVFIKAPVTLPTALPTF